MIEDRNDADARQGSLKVRKKQPDSRHSPLWDYFYLGKEETALRCLKALSVSCHCCHWHSCLQRPFRAVLCLQLHTSYTPLSEGQFYMDWFNTHASILRARYESRSKHNLVYRSHTSQSQELKRELTPPWQVWFAGIKMWVMAVPPPRAVYQPMAASGTFRSGNVTHALEK